MTRKTLTEWPTELPEGRHRYRMPWMSGDDDEPLFGHFEMDGDVIVFIDHSDVLWHEHEFEDGETFEPVDGEA